MATSSLYAVGSGLDIPTLVSQLVTAERTPAENRINKQGTTATTQLSAWGSIKSSLSSLQSCLESVVKSADNAAYKALVSDSTAFSASIVTDSSTGKTQATAGSYDIEVVSLAKSQKLTSAAFDSSAAVGSGTLTFSWGDNSVDVTIEEGSTLSSIASAINKAAGGKGVNATIITASDGQHLVLNSASSGTDGAVTVSASGGDGGLSALTWDGTSGGMTQTIAASNALIRVDGFDRESSSNTLTDVIPGVTLNLTKADEGSTQTLTITKDNSSLKTNLQAFVAAYNSSVSLLKSSSAYDSTNDAASALTGDSLVRSLQQQLRSQISSNVVDLKALGITIDKSGTMSFDSSKFDATIATDPSAATNMFGASGKLGSSMTTMLKSNLDTTGTLTQRTESLTKQIAKLEKELDDLDARMEKVSERYTKQFTAMDTLVAQMQSTSDYLTQQLSSSSSKS